MRRFTDGDGRTWDVVAGRESWGAIFAIFVPVDGGNALQVQLKASSYEQAHGELDRIDQEGLRELLASAEPKDPG